jgi:hypothetical protein
MTAVPSRNPYSPLSFVPGTLRASHDAASVPLAAAKLAFIGLTIPAHRLAQSVRDPFGHVPFVPGAQVAIDVPLLDAVSVFVAVFASPSPGYRFIRKGSGVPR